MLLSHSSHTDTSTNSVPNNISPISINRDGYSLILCRKIPDDIYYKLAKQFRLTQHTPNMNMDGFDAIFVDCRGSEIRCRRADTDGMPSVVLALIDEHSYLSDEPIKNNARFEFVTETELDSSLLKLRIDTHKFHTAHRSHTALAQTHTVKDNALNILEAFVQSSTDWMVLKDLNHRFLMASENFLKTHKKTAEQVIGKTDLEIGTPESEVLVGNAENNWTGFWTLDDEAIASGEPTYTEQLVIHENALEQVRERVARTPVKDAYGNVIGLLVCITQVYNANINGTNISTHASRREIDTYPIVRTLDEHSKADAVNKQTESAFKRKNNFIATASHDLRQPLHAIGLFIESLSNQIADKDQLATLAKMKQSSADLNELLNSILDITKLDADAVLASKTHFCIEPILSSIEDEFETEAKRKSLKLKIASSKSTVHTDSLLLVRIIRNLVNNAVKHTKTGSVGLLTEVDANSLLIHIKDTGPGIPKEQYQAIFTEHQLDNKEHNTLPNFGMGLGLSIVKKLSDLLGIGISIDSKLDSGTCFTLRIPLGDTLHTQANAQDQKNLDAFEPYKLLIVEDDPIVLEAMQEMLTSVNYDAYPASDIPEALEIINELDDMPDLLIVDYQLANGVTGDTAIEKICQEANTSLPAIIVTGNTNNALHRRASESAYRVLNKPVNPDVLLKTIASAVKKHQEATSKNRVEAGTEA